MRHRSTFALLTVIALGGCATWHPFAPNSAEAKLAPTRGNTAAGLITFRQQGAEMLLQGAFTGLTPGAHGLHIHEGGDCGGPGARDAGGHLNPTGARHGSPGSPSHHLGDLPMLTAGKDGTARFQARMDGLSLDEGPSGILGRAIIVTARPDDGTTQPTGNSGPAVGCGVIRPR
ncbi:MAG: superoxide dismutase family protein [Humidesulfovibrio sp.]|nr:superoxide dismutase family protein [Humidesulfovibrio sp.]